MTHSIAMQHGFCLILTKVKSNVIFIDFITGENQKTAERLEQNSNNQKYIQ